MRYSTMDLVDGKLVETSFKEINPHRCPHFIFLGSHYRDDGSCKCNDRWADGEMKAAGYRWSKKKKAWV